MHEQRRHFRKRVDLTLEYAGADERRAPGICRDFSLGGMHIDTTAPAAYGSQVIVFVRLNGSQQESKLPGTVRWVKAESMGVQFGLLGAHETYAIGQMLAGPE